MWRTTSTVADLLTEEIRERHMKYRGVISGQKTFEKRWEECVELVTNYLPIATSALYVKHFFKKESKDIAIELVNRIRKEFEITLKNTDWMDEQTRMAALKKAENMVAHIGYPDELTDEKKLIQFYEILELDENKFFDSVINISLHEYEKVLVKFRQPINKTSWEDHGDVAVINAFYSPQENSIRKLFS
jgi:neprilysin